MSACKRRTGGNKSLGAMRSTYTRAARARADTPPLPTASRSVAPQAALTGAPPRESPPEPPRAPLATAPYPRQATPGSLPGSARRRRPDAPLPTPPPFPDRKASLSLKAAAPAHAHAHAPRPTPPAYLPAPDARPMSSRVRVPSPAQLHARTEDQRPDSPACAPHLGPKADADPIPVTVSDRTPSATATVDEGRRPLEPPRPQVCARSTGLGKHSPASYRAGQGASIHTGRRGGECRWVAEIPIFPSVSAVRWGRSSTSGKMGEMGLRKMDISCHFSPTFLPFQSHFPPTLHNPHLVCYVR